MHGVESIYSMDGHHVNPYCGCTTCVMGMDPIPRSGNPMHDASALHEALDMHVFVFVLAAAVISSMS